MASKGKRFLLTCIFCGTSEDKIISIDLHYKKHEIQAMNRIAKALEGILQNMEAYVGDPKTEFEREMPYHFKKKELE